MKILLFGSSGMLGASLAPWLSACGHQVVTSTRGEAAGIPFDLANPDSTIELLQRVRPDVVINLVGLTNVDRCETHPKEAWFANVLCIENIAKACKAASADLIHLSTDQVYDSTPECSENQASPGNCYALTKYAGELAALSANATVLRTNFFGFSQHASRRSFTDWLFAALVERREITVFDDIYFSPLSMKTLCSVIEKLTLKHVSGIFNLGSCSAMSKADFAFTFGKALGLPGEGLKRSSASASPAMVAWRPKNMGMNSSLFETTFGIYLPTLQSEIEHTAKEYLEKI
jgi:dTDP-4-dehydrorhamnose reductase